MLELIKIKKDYSTGENVVHALKNVSLDFRKNEFVAILGPSGCGKTTLLNIIGGLDQYTNGDLIINGKSTKDFKDRDWDTYRNHSIGFVFQSYNLIPHQSVLQNVELALALSGVSKAERKERAKKALEAVGLSNQFHKKPSEMSGGQMQRVAIARALVNNPDIILADEPTGALDSETSIQVMEILKEVAKDRLVIMVTHNPELAQTYATRIVRMLDGEVLSDSLPLSTSEKKEEKNQETEKKQKKPSMSLLTSFSLSLKNLFTKKGRTTLTAFAGSIGIIGIALICSVSQGMTNYINVVQEETLSSYPLTIESQHMDLGKLMQAFIEASHSTSDHDQDNVYQKPALYDLINALNSVETKENDLRSFKRFIENEMANEESELYTALSGVQYTYDYDMLVYTKNVDGKIILSDTAELIKSMLGKYLSSSSPSSSESGIASMFLSNASNMVLWQELLSGDNGKLVNPLLEKQYDVIYGSWPNDYNQIVLVVDENNEIDDMTLYALGLKSDAEIDAIVNAAINKTELTIETKSWTYAELCNMQYRTILNSDCYRKDPISGLYYDLRQSDAGLTYLYDSGIDLKVSGIIRPKKDAIATMLSGSIGYTKKLTEYIIENAKKSSALQEQLQNPERNIFTGLPFENSSNLTIDEKASKFDSYISKLDNTKKAEAFINIKSIPDMNVLEENVNRMIQNMTFEQLVEQMVEKMAQQTGMSKEELRSYIEEMKEEDLRKLASQLLLEQAKIQYAEQIKQSLSSYSIEELSTMFESEYPSYTKEQKAEYYSVVIEFSSTSLEDNLRTLGYVELDNPSSIHLYAASFADKEIIEKEIKRYNQNVEEVEKISYTDYVGLMMRSVTTIINAITYVLIAFVAVSLIVSSIMIGVITLISVQERTKEIGILRAIGASKKNVSSMFNAETVMIGFSSGILGVGLTYILCIPINLILHSLTGIDNLNAYLPISAAFILIFISILLTLIAGIIPSRSAAKKDPVIALRSE